MDSMIKRLEIQWIGESAGTSNDCNKSDGANRMPAQKLISTGTLGLQIGAGCSRPCTTWEHLAERIWHALRV